MKSVTSFAIILIFFMILPVASAEIIASQPEAVYNIGDQLSLVATLRPSVQTTDFLTVKLVCPNGDVELYKNPLTIGAGETLRGR